MHTPTKKSVVWTFCRLNPPTIGHEQVINTVKDLALLEQASAMLFLSHTCDNDRNPIPWEEKCSFAKKAFSDICVVENESVKTPFQALEILCKQYKHITLVVGEDRAEEFLTSMTPYAKEWGAEHFAVINAGKRNSKSNQSIVAASATQARLFASNNEYDKFSKIIATTVNESDKKIMFNSIRKNLVNS